MQAWPVLSTLTMAAPDRGPGRVGVVVDDERGVAAQLHRHPLDVGGGAGAMSSLPTSVEPVNVSLRTAGLSISSWPIGTGSEVGTRLTTPGGRPTSSKILNTSMAHSGVCSAGLSTTVQPAASAGPSFRVSIDTG